MISDSLKILVVAESLDVNSGSGAKANMVLIKNLINAGFNLKVFHYTRQNIFLPASNAYSIPEKRRSVLFILSRVERYIRNLLNISLNPKIEKVTGFSFTLFNDRNSIVSALKKNKDFNPDWILTLSQGGSFRPHHALLKLPEWHRKWIAYIHDPYPMHWYPKPYTWREAGFKQKEEFMKKIAISSSYIAFPSKLLMEWMGSHFEEFQKKGIVIPHQIDFSTETKKPDEFEIDSDQFTVLHAGNLLQARKPDGLVNGFKKFVQRNPAANAQLIHVGPTSHYNAYLEHEAKRHKCIRVYCENRPFNEVSWLQRNASVNVIVEAKADFSPFLPGKFPHCIASGKPLLLLGPPKSEVRRLLGEKYPFWAEIDDADRIANLFEELYEKWSAGKIGFSYEEINKYLSSNYLNETLSRLKS